MRTRPDIPLRKHPVMRSFRVASKPIEDMLNTIVQWVDLQHPGGMIYGAQRLGKTEAIRHVMPLLREPLESDVPVYLMSCSGERIPSQGTFYEDLLRAANHSFSRSGTTQSKRYERKEHPEGSGWTYTRFFLPRAYEAGWRLAHQANLIWHVLQDAYPWDFSHSRKHVLPMAAFSKLCAFLLYELHEEDGLDLTLPEQLIREGVDLTHLPPMTAQLD